MVQHHHQIDTTEEPLAIYVRAILESNLTQATKIRKYYTFGTIFLLDPSLCLSLIFVSTSWLTAVNGNIFPVL